MMIKNNGLKLRRLVPKILLQSWQITQTSEQKPGHTVWVKNKLAVFNIYSHLEMASVVSSLYIYMLLSCMSLTLHISGNQFTWTITPVPLNTSRIAFPFGLSKEIKNIYFNFFCLTYEKIWFSSFNFYMVQTREVSAMIIFLIPWNTRFQWQAAVMLPATKSTSHCKGTPRISTLQTS